MASDAMELSGGAKLEGVKPTNNHAERTLLWRKICFGNHSEADLQSDS